MTHPYQKLDAPHFWSRVVATPAAHELDPMVSSPFTIDASNPVATIGSCFAQNISRFLRNSGLNYFVAERGPESLDEEERWRRAYGVFSARYGNVYTVRQAVQLFDRAFGEWKPDEKPWRLGDTWVDPFRPHVEPGGWATVDLLDADRQRHLEATRRVFTDTSVLVFTLGLTEGWRSRDTGAVYPVVPGVSGGTYDPACHEFVNFPVTDVIEDLMGFVDRVHSVNSTVRVLLTVSPVPLIATFTDHHVLTATTYSKSVLRVAAAEVEAARPFVTYFPAYEIITAPATGGRYYEPDLRSVTELGVNHVMRVFSRHFVVGAEQAHPVAYDQTRAEISVLSGVVCDEEVLDRD